MDKLTFNVYDWRTFNKSTIIHSVRSIRIFYPWKDININSNSWLQFTTRIGQTVRKIIFEFACINYAPKWKSVGRAKKIILLLLHACPDLEELHILNPHVISSLAAAVAPTTSLLMPTCKNIKTLVFSSFNSTIALQKFLTYFPKSLKNTNTRKQCLDEP